MKTRWNCFKLYLLVLLAAAAVCGCQTSEASKAKKLLSTMRLHLETGRNGPKPNEAVPVYRAQVIMVNVEKTPFLSEEQVADAKVIDEVGGYVLRVQFDPHGTVLLEQATTGNRGLKIAIFSQFGEKMMDYRWLAAPVITHRITDGVLVFTPDATREETEEIAAGLNNVSKKVHTWVDK
jgi:hypothetical protein